MAAQIDSRCSIESLKSIRIGFWGAGNIAQAMTKGFIRSGIIQPHNVAAVASTPHSTKLEVMKSLGVTCYATIEEMVDKVDVVILAVKPHQALDVLRKHRLPSGSETRKTKALVSVVAGIPLSDLKKAYAESPASDANRIAFIFFRSVPNTAAAVQEGVCAISVEDVYKNSTLCSTVLSLFSLLGYSRLFPEYMLDSVTASSGSGIAFMYVVLESMADAAVLVGIPREAAQELAIQTMLGAAKMTRESNKHTAELKDAVCSPGGTTIAGIHELERIGLRNSLLSAVKAAKDKAEELGKR